MSRTTLLTPAISLETLVPGTRRAKMMLDLIQKDADHQVAAAAQEQARQQRLAQWSSPEAKAARKVQFEQDKLERMRKLEELRNAPPTVVRKRKADHQTMVDGGNVDSFAAETVGTCDTAAAEAIAEKQSQMAHVIGRAAANGMWVPYQTRLPVEGWRD
jgi:hypothetical protein